MGNLNQDAFCLNICYLQVGARKLEMGSSVSKKPEERIVIACNYGECPYKTSSLPVNAAVTQLESHILSHRYSQLDLSFLDGLESNATRSGARSWFGDLKEWVADVVVSAMERAIRMLRSWHRAITYHR